MFYYTDMADGFAELHCHSDFSFLDGASPADDLVERALELGLSAVAVTDHQGLYGAVRFTAAAREGGLHAVVGMEVELLDSSVPDPARIVVPRRRRPPRNRGAPPESGLGVASASGMFGTEGAFAGPGTLAETVASAAEGRPLPPCAERKRPPGHRDPVREDLRGIAPRELGPHLVLLARDESGYRSLCRLASAGHLAGTKGVPRFTHELLARHVEGLVCLTGCRHGELSRRLLAGDREGAVRAGRRLAELFGPQLFVELQHHLLPDDDWLVAELARLAQELGLPTLVTNDAHYARREDRELQDVLVGIRHGMTLDDCAHLRRPNGEYALKGEGELRLLPPALPGTDPLVRRAWAEGMAAAADVASRCRVDLEFERYRFPGFPVPSGETAFSELEKLCHDGARHRYHPLTPRVVKQLAHELEVIERTGLAEFFLICWDLMRFCRERGIPAQGRGSAGDSIVAYVLGITRVDPIRHDLLFERFINEGRTTYPDVDIDFASSRREEVIQYVYERYGTEHAGMVCNVVTYRARSAVREVGYALGFPRPLVDRVAKALETYDSVMVRRDLEAEGGFAEFFQGPGAGMGDETSAAGACGGEAPAGSSPAAGGSLPQAVAAAAATEAARIVGERTASLGFVDSMGELAHGRGGRWATGEDEEHGTGRLVRREDVGRIERDARAVTGEGRAVREAASGGLVHRPPGERGGPTRIVDLLPRLPDAPRPPGADRPQDVPRLLGAVRTLEPLPDALAPRTGLRRGPSDDEGGPGDTLVSVRWLRAEMDGRAEAEGRTATEQPSGVEWRTGAELGASGSSLGSSSGRVVPFPAADGPRLTPGNQGPVDLTPGNQGPVDFVPESPDPVDLPPLELAPAYPEDAWAHLPSAIAPGTIGGRAIDPGTGVLLPAERPKRLGRGGDRGVPAADRGVPATTRDGATTQGSATARDGATPAGQTANGDAQPRRVIASSMGGIVLDPIPPRPRGSTIGLTPWDRWLELCARIDGLPRHLSIHVGGMLITRAPLVDIAPLERATMPGRVVVQYDKRDVETLKLIKLDLLGLRMLSAIDDALRDISVDCAVHVDLDHLPEDIPEVFRMIQAADTVGVFQIESRAQMQTLPRSRPTTLDDLVVEVAIIRPGPIQGNAVHPYLRRRQGLEPVTYLHPSLEPALKETLGVILYQEQVMKVAIDVAGFSAGESDGFRRAMGTWRSRKEMEKLHARFVGGCMQVSGLTAEQAEELFSKVAGFASFGFNKSHAAAFARTAYESAFLKLFYPAQFVAGLINAQPMGFYPVEVLINDAKHHGVPVLPVDINRSSYRTATEWAGMPDEPLPDGAGIERRPTVIRSSSVVVPDRGARDRYAAPGARGYGIRLGLHLVKGIGEAEGKALDADVARGGPYRSLADLVARTELSEEVIGRLIRAGALDSLGRPRRELLWQLREIAAATRGTDGRMPRSRTARPLDLRLPPTAAPDLPPPSELERLGDSYAILSLDARRQVLELFRPALDRLGALTLARLDGRKPGRVAIGGLVVTRQHPMTARGTVFLALEDETGMVNVTLWPKAWAEMRGVVRRHALLYVEGVLESESGVINLIARRIQPLIEVCRPAGGPSGAPGVRHMGHAGMRRVG